MTFKDVALKNFKFNIKKYFAYFLCTSFSITVLFMYSTLLFNDEIVKVIKGTTIHNMMEFCLVILVVFCFVFISYAHSTFMKCRSKEFGLFLTLGMTKNDINRIINLENSCIISASLTVGLLTGTVFSKLFHMIVTKILQLKGIKFILNYKSYALSIGLFLLISVVVIFVVKIYIKKLEISELLKNNKECENNGKKHPVLGFLGLVLIISSFILIHFTIKGDIFKHQPYMVGIYVCMCLLGLYLGISEFGALSIKLHKKNNKSYLDNILSLNEINYKFKQYKKILYIVCMFSGAAIFFIGLTFGMYVTTKSSIIKDYPYDIMYIETSKENKINSEDLKTKIEKAENPIIEVKYVNFTRLPLCSVFRGENFVDGTLVLSESEANKVLESPVDVKKGKAIKSFRYKEIEARYKIGDIITFKDVKTEKIYEFDFEEEIYGALVNYVTNVAYDTLDAIILDDEDYKNIVCEMGKEIFKYHLINFRDWKNTEDSFNTLMDILKESNGISKTENLWESGENWKTKGIEALRPVSKLEAFNHKIKENGFFFFVMSFTGLLFLICSGVVLYFKIYSDIDSGKERYEKLFKLGITDTEMKKVISKELKPIFFIPVILGSIAGIGYIAVMFINYEMFKSLMLASIVVVLIYLILQTMFYFITKNKYLKEILE